MMEKKKKERRRHIRVGHVFKVDYRTPEALFNEFAENISEGGIFIKTQKPLEVGTEIVIHFFLPILEEPIRVRGRVEWNTNMPGVKSKVPGMGVSFQQLSPEDKEKINSVIRELKKF